VRAGRSQGRAWSATRQDPVSVSDGHSGCIRSGGYSDLLGTGATAVAPRQTFESVTAARAAAVAAQGPAEQAKAENALSATLRSLFAVSEAYPQLQASRNFADLQVELSDTENRIAYSRQYYNDAVLTYNNSVQTVPTNIVAGIGGFTPRESFEAPDEERRPVQVRF
jgi:LemA protein